MLNWNEHLASLQKKPVIQVEDHVADPYPKPEMGTFSTEQCLSLVKNLDKNETLGEHHAQKILRRCQDRPPFKGKKPRCYFLHATDVSSLHQSPLCVTPAEQS
jgi:hypothetical protein